MFGDRVWQGSPEAPGRRDAASVTDTWEWQSLGTRSPVGAIPGAADVPKSGAAVSSTRVPLPTVAASRSTKRSQLCSPCTLGRSGPVARVRHMVPPAALRLTAARAVTERAGRLGIISAFSMVCMATRQNRPDQYR
jgi:hypothetical protein